MSDPVASGAGYGAAVSLHRVEPPSLPWDVDGWPEESRRSYGAELRRIGLVAEPRVVAYGAADSIADDAIASLIEDADALLVALWSAGDAESRVPIADALAQVDALRAAGPDLTGP